MQKIKYSYNCWSFFETFHHVKQWLGSHTQTLCTYPCIEARLHLSRPRTSPFISSPTCPRIPACSSARPHHTFLVVVKSTGLTFSSSAKTSSTKPSPPCRCSPWTAPGYRSPPCCAELCGGLTDWLLLLALVLYVPELFHGHPVPRDPPWLR